MPKYLSKKTKRDLYETCKKGDKEKLLEILSKNAPINTNRPTYLYAARLACRHGHIKLVKVFIEYGLFTIALLDEAPTAEIFCVCFEQYKSNATYDSRYLERAIEFECVDIVKFLCELRLMRAGRGPGHYDFFILTSLVANRCRVNRCKRPRFGETLKFLLHLFTTVTQQRLNMSAIVEYFKDRHIIAFLLLINNYRIAFTRTLIRHRTNPFIDVETEDCDLVPYLMNRHIVYTHKTRKYTYSLNDISKMESLTKTIWISKQFVCNDVAKFGGRFVSVNYINKNNT